MNYTYVEHKETGQPAIKLLDEPFAGIVYSYGRVVAEEDFESNSLFLNFEYELHDKANKEFGSMEPFEKYIGEVLQDLLHKAVSEQQDENT